MYCPVLRSRLRYNFPSCFAMLVDASELSLFLRIVLGHREISQQYPLLQRSSHIKRLVYEKNLKPLFLDSTPNNLDGHWTPELFVGFAEVPSLTASHQFSFSLCGILPPSAPSKCYFQEHTAIKSCMQIYISGFVFQESQSMTSFIFYYYVLILLGSTITTLYQFLPYTL